MTELNNENIMTIETNSYIDTTPFLNCKQMVNYKLNLLSRIENKCLVSYKSHINKDRNKIYLLLKYLKFFYKYYYFIHI